MYRVEVNSGINQIIKIFQCFGLWNDNESTCRKTLAMFIFFFFSTFPISLAAGAVISKDKDESIYLASVAITIVVQVARLFYIILRRSKIYSLMCQYGYIVTEDQKEFNKIKIKLEKLMKFGKYILIVGTIILILLFSAILLEKALPFNIGFPLDWKNSDIGYGVAFTFLFVQCTYSVVIFLLNFIIWYLMLTFAINYEVLGSLLKRMGTYEPTEETNQKRKFLDTGKQKFHYEDLIMAIEKHKNIGKTIDQFQSCFFNLFFIQIVSSGMCICGSVYTLAFSSHQNVFLSLYHVALMLYNFFDIFMLMYLGNEIKFSSGQLLYCLYESNWMEQSESSKKCIIILAEMLKRPYELVVGVIYPLNLETFSRILNLAYTMFNIIKAS